MPSLQRKTLIWTIAIAVVYFAAFIIPNLAGAKDPAMISVFEHDEFAQFPHVVRMITPGETAYQSLRNFVVYLHYYYGYPFYFFSALVLLPVKWILGSGWSANSQAIMLVLRQMINVLPMLLAVIFMVREQTRNRSLWKTIFLLIFLLTIPALVGNNLWWHPDSLLTLFSVLTILFLVLDDARLGKFYYISAITCGLAVGAKILGVLFILTYLAYLSYALVMKKDSLRKVTISVVLFLVVMSLVIDITNPLLNLPIERGEIISTFKANLSQSSQGFWVAGNGVQNKLVQIGTILQESYGGVILFLAAIVTLVIGLFKENLKLKNLIILTWLIGYMGYFVFFAATVRTHYFLPVVVPLYATLLDFFPDVFADLKLFRVSRKVFQTAAKLLLLLLLAVTLVINTWKSANTFYENSIREQTSPSIALYRHFETAFLPKLQPEQNLVVYRDWRAYVPDRSNWEVIYNWDLANYDYIAENQPDLLFIETDNVVYFSDPEKVGQALDTELMKRMYAFYTDVKIGEVAGYELLYKDDFGYIFVSDELFDKNFR